MLVNQIAVFLVAEGFDGRCVDDSLVVAETHGDRVFGDRGFTGRCVGGDEDGFLSLQTIDGLLLERVQFVGIGLRRGGIYFYFVARLVIV